MKYGEDYPSFLKARRRAIMACQSSIFPASPQRSAQQNTRHELSERYQKTIRGFHMKVKNHFSILLPITMSLLGWEIAKNYYRVLLAASIKHLIHVHFRQCNLLLLCIFNDYSIIAVVMMWLH
jgi:hypothetical protein